MESLTAKDAKERKGTQQENAVSKAIVDAAFRVHSDRGPGLLEPKAIDQILPIHMAQILSHLRLGGFRLGLLLNFNVVHMKDGIKRVANGM